MGRSPIRERRISRQRPFREAPDEAIADWKIIAGIGKRMGFSEAFGWQSPADIFAEFAALFGTENEGFRDFDISAFADVMPASYDQMRPFQWPKPKNATVNPSRFFGQGGYYTQDRRARFIAVKIPTVHSGEGLVLNTGRVRDHWHTMTRTGKSVRLSQHIAEPYCELNPQDAMRLGVRSADLVRIKNARGSVIVRASVTSAQRPGEIFVPMHWNDGFAADARIGKLIAGETDPVSGQPALKLARVSVTRFVPELYGFAVTRAKPALDAPYWAIAKIKGGRRTEFAVGSFDGDAEQAARQCLMQAGLNSLASYQDPRRGDWRFAAVSDGELTGVVYLSRDPVSVARSWAAELLEERHADIAALLAGRPGAGKIDKGATVCSCFSIGFNEIASAVLDGSCRSVQAIGESLKAGTNCGSCRSEIKRIIAFHLPAAAE